MLWKKSLFVVLTLILTFLFLIFTNFSNKPIYLTVLKDTVSNAISIPNSGNIIEESRNCYIKILTDWKKAEPITWLEIANLAKLCSKNVIDYIPYLETTSLDPEHKYYMIPKLEYMNDSCSVITFGVGGNIASEKHMQMVLPKCQFLGFDPNEQYETLFTVTLKGKFVQTAVGGKNERNSILRLTEKDGWKPTKGTKIRSAAELIETYYGKDKIVDILNIDVEGSEYSIFESIIKNDIFKNVCQINVEFHPVWYHETGYSFHQVIDILKNLIEDGTFLWMKSVVHSTQFFPSYFVNIKNSACIEKYLKGRLL